MTIEISLRAWRARTHGGMEHGSTAQGPSSVHDEQSQSQTGHPSDAERLRALFDECIELADSEAARTAWADRAVARGDRRELVERAARMAMVGRTERERYEGARVRETAARRDSLELALAVAAVALAGAASWSLRAPDAPIASPTAKQMPNPMRDRMQARLHELGGALPSPGTAREWTVREGGNGHWYQVVPFHYDETPSQSAARQRARAVGGALAVADSPGEAAFLRSLEADGAAPIEVLIIEWSADCNGDGVVDYAQIRASELADRNGDGVPDVCQ